MSRRMLLKAFLTSSFKENIVVVGLVHEVTGGVDCSFTPQGVSTPTWEGRRSLRSLGMKGLKQTLATRRR